MTEQATKGIGVGLPLPDIVLQDIDGNEHNLADLKGKRRLLYMWGSW